MGKKHRKKSHQQRNFLQNYQRQPVRLVRYKPLTDEEAKELGALLSLELVAKETSDAALIRAIQFETAAKTMEPDTKAYIRTKTKQLVLERIVELLEKKELFASYLN